MRIHRPLLLVILEADGNYPGLYWNVNPKNPHTEMEPLRRSGGLHGRSVQPDGVGHPTPGPSAHRSQLRTGSPPRPRERPANPLGALVRTSRGTLAIKAMCPTWLVRGVASRSPRAAAADTLGWRPVRGRQEAPRLARQPVPEGGDAREGPREPPEIRDDPGPDRVQVEGADH